MATNLTAKELTYIADLMTFESTACKKARLYAKTVTDLELQSTFTKIANNHEKRFNSLLSSIS